MSAPSFNPDAYCENDCPICCKPSDFGLNRCPRCREKMCPDCWGEGEGMCQMCEENNVDRLGGLDA